MGAILPAEVFLSHSSLDREFASDLAITMRNHGVPVWYSETNIMGAQQWQDEIGAALQRCDWFTLILSPRSVESMWVKRELAYALSQNRFENRILPIVLEPADFLKLSWTLPLFQMIDFSASIETGYRALLQRWGVGYRG